MLAELLGGIDGEQHGLVLAFVWTILFVVELDHPHVVALHDEISSLGHGLSLCGSRLYHNVAANGMVPGRPSQENLATAAETPRCAVPGEESSPCYRSGAPDEA